MSNSYIIDITEDKNGYLSLATEEGLNRLEGGIFSSFYKKDKGRLLNLTGNELNCLLDDPKEPILWIGTQRAGLNAFNYQTNKQHIFLHDDKNPFSIATNNVTNLAIAADGNLWVTTYWQGIDYLDKSSGKFAALPTSNDCKHSNVIWTIVDDHKGNLYIGHAQHGMSILSIKDKKIRNFTYNKDARKASQVIMYNLYLKNKTGNIWVGTEKGLALYKPENESFLRLGNYNSPLSHRIYDIKQFNENELWVATEFGGIAIINLSKILFNTVEEVQFIQAGDNEYNLNNSTVRCLFQDSHQNIWAGTLGGGVNFLSSNTALFKSFSYSPYSPGSNLNGYIASAACIDKQGHLWVGTDGGVCQCIKKRTKNSHLYRRNQQS